MSVQPSASRFRAKRQPDFENFRRTILRQGPPGPVPFAEFMADPGMVGAVLGEEIPADLRSYLEESLVNVSAEGLRGLLKAVAMYVRFCYEMGYDYVFMISGLEFRSSQMALADTATALNWAGGVRYWQNESSGPIQNWQDFEAYPWPRAEDISYAVFEYLDTILPQGMKVGATLGGVFENSTYLMGVERFSYALHDQPDLVEAICQRVGELTSAVAKHVASIDNVGMVFLGDDMGFYSGTLVSPDVLRRYVLPHNRKMAEAVHRAGKLFLLHSCGNMYRLSPELPGDAG
jgi:uroporphyrinogen decarboxylase